MYGPCKAGGSGTDKGLAHDNSEFIGPKGRIRVLNNKGIFILDNPDLDT